MPASVTDFSTCSGLASRSTPKDANTSAEPESEEKARLPCLATGTPAPATTKAVAVEILWVPWASPPVPTMSMAFSGAVMRFIFARMVAAAPVISSMVSPRNLSAIKNAPICAGVASPDIMMSKAALASACESVSCSETLVIKGFRSVIIFRHAQQISRKFFNNL